MIGFDVWALAVLAACVLIARRQRGEVGWTIATVAAGIAAVVLVAESLVAGRSGHLGEALALIPPALVSLFAVLPYLTVAVLFVTMGPRLTARLRGARPWLWSCLGLAIWTVLLTPTIAGQVMR